MRVIERLPTLCGETHLAGVPCALIRFEGCSLRCRWCDTRYAYQGGTDCSPEELAAWVDQTGLDLVLLTGGEPLLQPDLPALARVLVARHRVLVETSGAHDIGPLESPVQRSVDIKCPGSGESEQNLWDNLYRLRPDDAVKMVLSDRQDFDYAREVIREHRLGPPVHVLLSPVHDALDPQKLAQWIIEDPLPGVRLNLQIHRILWPALERR